MRTSLFALGLVALLVPPGEEAEFPDPPFGIGERLTFSVEYGPIRAGTATLTVVGIDTINGRPAFHFRSEARSNRTFSMFYEVRDQTDSWVDVERVESLKLEKHLREGNYRNDKRIEFFQDRNFMIDEDGDTLAIPSGAVDDLAIFYYVRGQQMNVGEKIILNSLYEMEKNPVAVQVLRRETIRVPAGTFRTLAIEPLVESVGIFKNEGRVTVWVTDDERKMPVMMKSKVFFGSVKAVLTDYETGMGLEEWLASAVSKGEEGD